MRAALVLAAFLAASPATAHHWYPDFCCRETDCFEVFPGRDIIVLPGAYLVVATGETFPIDQVHVSPPEANGEWARCTVGANPKNPTRCNTCPKACIFAPPAQF